MKIHQNFEIIEKNSKKYKTIIRNISHKFMCQNNIYIYIYYVQYKS